MLTSQVGAHPEVFMPFVGGPLTLIDYESQKIKKTVLSTTHLHEVLWFMSVSLWIVDGRIW